MAITLITIAEIQQRQAMLTEQAARMPPGPERDRVVAEIEMLKGSAAFKRLTDLTTRFQTTTRAAPRQPHHPTQLQYAEFRSLPCRYDDAQAWLFVNGRWQKIDITNQRDALIPRSKASFKWLFGADLPPLPHAAFQVGRSKRAR